MTARGQTSNGETDNMITVLAGRRLGHELRVLRELAGLSGRELASLMGLSQSVVSRIENGHAVSNVRVREWARATNGGDDTYQRLRALNERAHAPSTQPQAQGQAQGLEANAGAVRVFDPVGIPPLLWTPMYAFRVMRAAERPGEASTAATFMEELEKRQAPLLSGRKHYEFVLVESALPPITTPIDRGQRGRILSLEAMVSVTAVPRECPLPALDATPFTLYDDEDGEACVVGVRAPHGEVLITDHKDVRLYQNRFAQFAAQATPVSWD
jgi:DNA-binding XRE family transcriptional regulator